MSKSNSSDNKSTSLPPIWQEVQSAIWLIGLAILFWQGWFWPGILVLAAVSGLTQALLMAYVNRQEETRALEETRELFLPENCPNCGGPVTKGNVHWTGRRTAACPFCGSPLKVVEKAASPAR